MANWREQKRKALAGVHRQFQLDAVYVTHAGGTPVSVRVRLHRKIDQSQPQQGGDWSDGAFNVDLSDRIIFEASAVDGAVLHNSYVIFSDHEAYITSTSAPSRDGYIRVDVTPVAEHELVSLLSAFNLSDPVWARVI